MFPKFAVHAGDCIKKWPANFLVPSTKSLDASTTSICSYSYIIYVKYSCYARAVASSFCTMLLLGMLFHMMHKSWHIPCIECDYVSYVFL